MRIKIDKTDKEFSLYIRNRDNWTCQRCKRQYPEGTSSIHCSHFWGRGRENTRFDEENCSAICFGCHNYFHANPSEHRKWKLNQLGEEKFNHLEIRANLTGSKRNREFLYLYYKKLNENL